MHEDKVEIQEKEIREEENKRRRKKEKCVFNISFFSYTMKSYCTKYFAN